MMEEERPISRLQVMRRSESTNRPEHAARKIWILIPTSVHQAATNHMQFIIPRRSDHLTKSDMLWNHALHPIWLSNDMQPPVPIKQCGTGAFSSNTVADSRRKLKAQDKKFTCEQQTLIPNTITSRRTTYLVKKYRIGARQIQHDLQTIIEQNSHITP